MKKPALLFDLDGTLFDSEYLTYNALEKTLNRISQEGLYPVKKWERNLFKHVIGMTSDQLFLTLIPDAPKEVLEYAKCLLVEYEQELLKSEGMLYPDVKKVLTLYKKAGFLLYIASNGGARYVTTVVDYHGLSPFFDGIYCAGLQNTKSKVDLVKLILEDCGPYAVMIGDRYSDIEAGRKNGLITVGCAYGFGTQDEINNADYIISSLSDLLNIIKIGEKDIEIS